MTLLEAQNAIAEIPWYKKAWIKFQQPSLTKIAVALQVAGYYAKLDGQPNVASYCFMRADAIWALMFGLDYRPNPKDYGLPDEAINHNNTNEA